MDMMTTPERSNHHLTVPGNTVRHTPLRLIHTSGAASAGRKPRETRIKREPGGIASTVSAGPRGSVARRGGSCVAEPWRLGVHSPGTTKSHAAGLWRAEAERPARTGGSSDRPYGPAASLGGMRA